MGQFWALYGGLVAGLILFAWLMVRAVKRDIDKAFENVATKDDCVPMVESLRGTCQNLRGFNNRRAKQGS